MSNKIIPIANQIPSFRSLYKRYATHNSKVDCSNKNIFSVCEILEPTAITRYKPNKPNTKINTAPTLYSNFFGFIYSQYVNFLEKSQVESPAIENLTDRGVEPQFSFNFQTFGNFWNIIYDFSFENLVCRGRDSNPQDLATNSF